MVVVLGVIVVGVGVFCYRGMIHKRLNTALVQQTVVYRELSRMADDGGGVGERSSLVDVMGADYVGRTLLAEMGFVPSAFGSPGEVLLSYSFWGYELVLYGDGRYQAGQWLLSNSL